MAENYTCEACGASFKTKPELEAHEKKAHPQPSQTPVSGQKKPM